MSIDLASLPRPQAIEEIDYERILAERKTDLVSRHPAAANVIDLESEPLVKGLEENSYRETLVRARVNDAFRSSLLAFAGGSDLDHLAAWYDVQRLADEPDDRLRLRVQLAIHGRSTGGTETRYRSVAMSASLRVKDAQIYRIGKSPVVHVAVYAADLNGLADEELLAEVEAALTAPDVRMINDTIEVRAAVFRAVAVTANVWLLPETPDSVMGTLPQLLRGSWAAETGLGFDLTRSWLCARLMRPGIQRVEVVSPAADEIAAPYEAISLGAINLTLAGRAW